MATHARPDGAGSRDGVGFEAGILLGEHLAGPGLPIGRNSTALLAALGVTIAVAVVGGLISTVCATR